MQKSLSNEKGVVLVTTILTIVLALVFSSAFFMRSISEKRLADAEKFIMQTDFLAEAGANHALAELRERIRVDLPAKVNLITNPNNIRQYLGEEEPLDLLVEQAYSQGASQFEIVDDEAILNLTSLGLVNNIEGDYTAHIVITVPEEPQAGEISLNVFNFYYDYRAIGLGTSTAITPNIEKQITLSGSFTVTIRQDNFAAFALFTNHHSTPSGGSVWFTDNSSFNGPVHTNDQLYFLGEQTSTPPGLAGTFTNLVSQSHERAWFYNDGDPRQLPQNSNPPWDVPAFGAEGFQRGVGIINLPSAVTQQNLKAQALGGVTEPRDPGVYVPLNEAGTAVAGGIFIKGDTTVNLDKDASNPDNKAVITATQSANTTTITIEYAHDGVPATTTVATSIGTATYQGIPDGVGDEGIIIYGAPSRGSGKITLQDADSELVVQTRTKMTISCEDDIIVQDHVRYQGHNHEPNLNAEGYDNMLGLLVWGGNSDVIIGTSAPDDLEIHGIVMSEQGVFTVEDYNRGEWRGTVDLLGGSITNFYGPFGTIGPGGSGYGRNFIYDSRVLSGQIPPYFPFLGYFNSAETGLEVRPVWRKG